ncbi:hypothetical protein BGW37DRAFT_520378 [Umbelopsis sp. PMI_123]|nr:hypothetical protein BGW37DRAFT_520378 [Umbelopsis sp. PMI_123]
MEGLGAEAARVIAKHHAALVVVAGRKQESLDDTIQKIKAETPSANLRSLILDLSLLESVRHAAAEVNAYPESLDVLINNAAIMSPSYYTTKDGFGAQFGTNHIGPFLFTNLTLPKLLASKTGAPRIINVSSISHIFSPIRFDDPFFDNGKAYDSWASYGQSKTANIFLHPGGIQTNISRDVKPEEVSVPTKDYDGNAIDIDMSKFAWKSIPQGTSTHIVAAFDPNITWESGSYLDDCQVAMDHDKPYAKDDTQAKTLWQLSEKIARLEAIPPVAFDYLHGAFDPNISSFVQIIPGLLSNGHVPSYAV